MRPLVPSAGSSLGTPHPILVLAPPGAIEPGLARAAAHAGAVGVVDLVGRDDRGRDAALAALRVLDPMDGAFAVRVRADDGPALGQVHRAVRFGPVSVVVTVGVPQSDEVAELGFAGARVLAELDTPDEAPAAAAAGVQGFVLRLPDDLQGQDARLGRMIEWTQMVQRIVRIPVYAHGAVSIHNAAPLREAGVAGFVLDVQAWLTTDSPIAGARDRVTGHPDHLHAVHAADTFGDLTGLVRGIMAASQGRIPVPEAAPVVDTPQPVAPPPVSDPSPRTEREAPIMTPQSPSGNGQHTERPQEAPIDLAEGIAVVGMGCVLPKANDVDRFWQNLVNGTDCIVEVPKDRWDTALFYDPAGKGDTSYTKIGGFVTDFTFDPIAFRIPPKTAQALDPVQQMTLTAAKEAFVRAGYLDEKLKEARPFDRERTAVILGNSMGGEIQREYSRRIVLPRILDDLRKTAEVQAMPEAERNAFLQRFADDWVKHYPAVTEDSMPGELSNVVAGRIANVFDLKGKNHTADAACASSFAALDAAVKGLVERDFDMVVCGGADRSMDIDTYVKFCKIGALSANGSTPFDARADGFVMGEGVALFLLKRLSDAVRDGDEIHAVIRGVGASSDGKGKGITAPNQRGQVLAVDRGLQAGGYPPDTVQYIEAHGTSTKVGDVVELQSLSEAIGKTANGEKIPVGSVKSQIGHLKSAAGAAALLKTILALKNNTIPPSINFETPNPNIDWDQIPFRVPTQAEPWPQNKDGLPRRAGISSFGFGGTNFHVVLEEFVPELHASPTAQAARPATRDAASHYLPRGAPATVPQRDPEAIRTILAERAPLEGETLVLGASDQAGVVEKLREVAERFPTESPFLETGEGPRLKDLVYPYNRDGVKADVRVALVCKDLPSVREQATFALSCLDDPARMKIAPVKGVFAGQGAPKGKIAFLFPGQGSQYAEMLLDLYRKYAIVRDTFAEADDIMLPLIGKPLTPLIFPDYDRKDENARKEALAQAEESLRQTEICQPAVLTADIAIWRLLRSMGIDADVVAGHSLGEYAALVAAGIIRFEDALLAVSARGKEMAHVDVPDLGKMASITAPFETVQEVLAACQGYVIPANKNCPAMTVIAGASDGVDEAVAKFQERGIQAQYIPVSAAFHSGIVAPASAPLRSVLSRLSIRPPHTPIYANVTGRPYETTADGRTFKDYVLDVLAKQVASPVEWTETIQNMYADGVRTFIEVGPKRALTGFITNILEGKDHIAVGTNHPKKGGIYHINETYAVLAATGHIPKAKHPHATSHYTLEHLEPLGAARPPAEATPAAATPAVEVQERVLRERDPVAEALATAELRALAREAPFAAYARQQAPIVSAMLRAGYEQAKAQGLLPATNGGGARAVEPTTERARPGFPYSTEDLVISGASIGLPGRSHRLFDDANIDRILNGENCIDLLTEDERAAMTDKNIVRLTKGTHGEAGFETIQDTSQVIKLAAKLGDFDLNKEFGIDADFAEVLDITSKMAIGAAVDALRDAGIPLVRSYQKTTTGSYLPKDWTLPASMQDETGIIFASAFPGYDALLDEVSKHMAYKHAGRTRAALTGMMDELVGVVSDPATRQRVQTWLDEHTRDLTGTDAESLYTFNRKFLFYILSMGHAQLAQLIKAKGPNVQINAACSSTTEAVAIAEDWIRTGRCRRVIVVGADAATSDRMFEWIGSGFLVSGAATTKEDIREAALPFDRRRHGMIIGSGAVGLIIEAREEARKRGMDGLVKILSTQVANSAFHGSRLDVQHIAGQMDRLVQIAEERYGFDRATAAKELVFMSHETYTPARGGSASAEIESLRRTFGDHADEVIVSNTKGFTGHPMGAGIEDAIAVKALQLGKVPPVANLVERDPELGNLNLSKGGETDARYTLRLAAGFGSQIAFWLGERLTKGTERVVDATKHQAWLREVSGQEAPQLEVVNRTLRIVDAGAPEREPTASVPQETVTPQVTPQVAPAPVPPTPTPSPAPTAPTVTPTAGPDRETILSEILQLVVDQTGYPAEMLEPDLDLEADLGIDTVKQAELFGIIRSKYGLPQEEGVQIKDYPTLGHIAGYVAERSGGKTETAPVPETAEAPASAPTTVPSATAGAPSGPAAGTDREAVLQEIIQLVVDQTGYPADMLEPDLDLEADLGIDTVKQAELFGIIRSKYGLPQEEGLQIKDYPTLGHIAGYVTDRAGSGDTPAQPAPAEEPAPTPPAATPEPSPEPAQGPKTTSPSPPQATPDPATILAEVTNVLVEQTGYPADMLEPGLDLEADLGIDTVKQAELFGIIRSKYGLPQEEGMQIKDYPTLGHIADYVAQRAGATGSASAPSAPAEPPAPTPAPQAQPVEPRQATLQVAADPAPKKAAPVELDDGAPTMDQPRAAAAPVVPPKQQEAPIADPLGLDDGAPSFTAPAAPAPAAPRPVKAPAPQTTELDDGAPSFEAAPAQAPVARPAPAREQTTVASTAPEPAPAPVDKQPQPSGAAAAAGSTEDVVEKVTALIAEKTGYPADMLEPDLDLEADLGIDTVKQAEIFGEVRALFGLPLPENLKIADYPTIRRVAGFVSEQQSSGGAPVSTQEHEAPTAPATTPAPVVPSTTTKETAPAQRPETPAVRTGAASERIQRLVVVPRDAPLDKARPRDPMLSGPLLLTQDRLGWADEFAALLTAEGHTVVLLGDREPPASVPGHFVSTDLTDVTSIEKAVTAVRGQLGGIGGIVHLAALDPSDLPDSVTGFKDHTRRGVRALYALARAAAEDLSGKKGAPVLTVTRMGGTFGLPGTERGGVPPFHALEAGAAGLTKALAKEFPDAYVRVVDLGAEFGPQDAARRAWKEMKYETDRVEVGHPELHRRIVVDLAPRITIRATLHPLHKDDHLVASGGAQGITAAAVAALLERVGPEHAPCLTLLGRTRLPEDIETLAGLSESDLAARKKALLESLRQQHERVTPVMLEKEWSKTTKALEVHANLRRFETLGATVRYVSVDVQDQDAVRRELASGRETFGPVTGILHGAGLEISKQLADKDPDQFDRVFEVKTLGLHNLLVATQDDPLRSVCVFSSVAGRFGNLGQVDYSAANDLAVHQAMSVGAARGFRGFGIDWSAWADVGMATRGGIMTVMEQSGVTPIPVGEGTRFFVDEWLTGDIHPEVVIAGALGAIDADHQVREIPLPPQPPVLAEGKQVTAPLFDAIIAHDGGRYAVAARTLAVDRDLYLNDHRVEGVPYLPGVFGVEMFAETAATLLLEEERAAEFAFVGAEDIDYHTPVKLLRDRPLAVRVVVERISQVPVADAPAETVMVPDEDDDAEILAGGRVDAAPEEPEPEQARFRCRLESDFVNEQGQVLGDVRVHFEGIVVFGVRQKAPVRANGLPIRPEEPGPLFAREDVYDHFFHGPTFQVLDAVSRIEGAHVAAVARFAHDGLFAEEPRPIFQTAPLAREAAFQATGFWALAERSRMSLPAGIRRVVHYGQPDEAPPGTSLIVLGRFERDLPDGQHAEYTVEVYTPEGVLVDRMEGFRMVTIGGQSVPRREDTAGGTPPAPTLETEPATDDAPAMGRLVESAEESDGDWELMVREPPEGKESGAVARVGDLPVAHVDVKEVAVRLDDAVYRSRMFTEAERNRIDGLSVPKRREEHAAGLIAAKEAIRRALDLVGVTVTPDRIEVAPDPETRAPTWHLVGHAGLLPTLHLSVSHSNGHAVAAAAADPQALGLGVDVEAVAPRAAGFAETAFAPEERSLAEALSAERGWSLDEVVTRFWCVKEATLKGLRTGLALDLKDVRVTALGSDGAAEVRMLGEAARHASAVGGSSIVARSGRFAPGIVGASARLVREEA